MSEEANIGAYFERIGFAGSIAPTTKTLEQLHGLHPAAIAFENLNPLMGLPVRLGLSDLEQKLVIERRGGYCFEHNLLFRAVLETLDFPVKSLGARVLLGHEGDELPPVDHIVLAVEIGGVSYLADVGFGGNTPTAPLRLRADQEQETPNERFRLSGGEPDWLLETEIEGEWRRLYSFDLSERSPEEYRQMNEVAAVSFRDDLVAARAEPGKRYALRNNRLNIHSKEAGTETRTLGSTLEIRDALTNLFRIQLPLTDKLDPALEKALRPRESA